MNVDVLMNAADEKNMDVTYIVLWTHIDRWRCASYPDPDAPQHGEFGFIPAEDPSAGTPKTPANGWYTLEYMGGNKRICIDASGNAELNEWNLKTVGKREFYVENKGKNQITL